MPLNKERSNNNKKKKPCFEKQRKSNVHRWFNEDTDYKTTQMCCIDLIFKIKERIHQIFWLTFFEGHSINKVNFSKGFDKNLCGNCNLFKEINTDGSFLALEDP